MQLDELKKLFTTSLESLYSKPEISTLYSIVLEDGLGIDRTNQLMNPTRILDTIEKEFCKDCIKSLAQGRPIQQIIKKVQFYNLNLEVDENVLIPRPETEELIELIKHDFNKEPDKVLDIGTGSGCIATSLKSIYNNALVIGMDISEEALAVAKRNARANDLEVQFTQQDILLTSSDDFEHRLDLIVSNPPYISLSEKEGMSKSVVDFEPHLALFVKNDNPLEFYEAIEVFASKNLNKGGSLYLEINQNLGKETADLYIGKGWKVNLYKDLSGNDRFLKVWA